MDQIDPDNQIGFDAAVQYFRTQARLARALQVTPQAVSYYKRAGLTAEAAVEIEKATRGKLSAVRLLEQEQARLAQPIQHAAE